ncbi:uncharacterized protein RSE6_04242 [Rhynchosporium secalis]|uniref:Zn(2)-C6 fungal-type domain-containing protein n=1 Tax=Rhynchosporium secalis TaxID=38038 RepID=A0A1E1M4U1_RHYSE|nr:uncharacterized protein RSE6_04242 [Rhynchosporium secalis]
MLPLPLETSGEQRMQRPHRKSRFGCKICKARKIKCDEKRPICGPCIKRFPNPEEECCFEALSPPVTREHSSSSSPASAADAMTNTLSRHAARAMELRLFHHYSTTTCHTMPLVEEDTGREMWLVTVPTSAFEYPYVYTAVLAIAALHLLGNNPNDVSLQTATYQYIDESLSGYRNELKNINQENSAPVFTAALLLSMNARLRHRCYGANPPPYTLPLNYLHLQLGIRQVYFETHPFIQDSSVRRYVDLRRDLKPEIKRESLEFPMNVNRNGFQFPHDVLYSTWGVLSTNPERTPIYAITLTYLSGLKDGIGFDEEIRWIQRRLAWLIQGIPREFVTYLEEGDPLAIVILSRFYALLKYIDEPWWIQGAPEFEIRGMASLVGEEWKWAMEWPLEVLEVAVRVGYENRGL